MSLQAQPPTQTVTVTSQPPSAQIPPVQLPLQPLPPSQQTVQTHLSQLQPVASMAGQQPVLDLQLKNVVQQVRIHFSSSIKSK